jgi:hypothetical protein
MEQREEQKLNSYSIQFEDDESISNIPQFSAFINMGEGGIMSQR